MDYFEPKTISEALALLKKYGGEAKVIARGTDVMVDIKYKEEPGCLINIKAISGLAGIKENNGGGGIRPPANNRGNQTQPVINQKTAASLGRRQQIAVPPIH